MAAAAETPEPEEEVKIPEHTKAEAAVAEEEPPREELKRPKSAVLSNADYKKKEKQRPKFEKLKEKIDTKKDAAAGKFKDGQYAEAIALYKNSAELLQDTPAVPEGDWAA